MSSIVPRLATPSRIPLATQLMLVQALVLPLVLGGVSYFFLNRLEAAIRNRTLDQLDSVRALKSLQIAEELAKVRKSLIEKQDPSSSGVRWIKVEKAPFSSTLDHCSEFYCPVIEKEGTPRSHSFRIWIRTSQQRVLTEIPTIDQILHVREGLLTSGESYLVGPSGLMQTPSRFPPFDKNWITVRTQAVAEGSQAQTGRKAISDYRGVRVLSSFAPLPFLGKGWVILSEMDENEVLQLVVLLRSQLDIVVATAFLFGLLFSALAGRKLVKDSEAAKLRRWVEGQEQERARLALDLHDGLGQLLTWQSLQVAAAGIPDSARATLNHSHAQIGQELRRIVQNLRPNELIRNDLRAALSSLFQTLPKTEGQGLHVDLALDPNLEAQPLPEFISVQIYRMIQELLTNTLRHSQATHASLTLSRETARLFIVWEDNGRGLPRGVTLRSLEDRLRFLGGAISHFPLLPGLRIQLSVPTHSPEDE